MCPASNVDDFRIAMERLVSDEALRESMGENALERSRNYDIKIIENYMKDIYSGE